MYNEYLYRNYLNENFTFSTNKNDYIFKSSITTFVNNSKYMAIIFDKMKCSVELCYVCNEVYL